MRGNMIQNDVWSIDLLQKPDSSTLKHIFIVQSVINNHSMDESINDSLLIDSLLHHDLIYNELLVNYYHTLFDKTLAKNRPFEITTANFDLNKLNLENDAEKAIFVLTYNESANMFMWGYMNIVRPPNCKAAQKIINAYSTFNGLPYFEHTKFDLEDFDIRLETGKPKISFKAHYINKLYETLYYHYMCLSQKKKYSEMKNKLVDSSILTKKKYWKYCKNRYVFKIGLE